MGENRALRRLVRIYRQRPSSINSKLNQSLGGTGGWADNLLGGAACASGVTNLYAHRYPGGRLTHNELIYLHDRDIVNEVDKEISTQDLTHHAPIPGATGEHCIRFCGSRILRLSQHPSSVLGGWRFREQ